MAIQSRAGLGVLDGSRKKTLNAKNLEALGAQRLAEVLSEISTGDAAVKRRLRLELAGREGPGAVAREVRKRLATIAWSRSVVDWHGRPWSTIWKHSGRAIKEQVATCDPVTGLGLMWRFLALAGPVLDRCEDGGGATSEVFDRANEIATLV